MTALGAALLEERMQATFGMSHREYTSSAVAPVPKAYLANAMRIVDDSGVMAEMDQWNLERRKSRAGRKPIIPMRAVLVLFMLNVQMGKGVAYLELATTLDLRFRAADFELLGIRDLAGDLDDWYKRIWAAADRMLELINPYPAPHNRKLEPEEFRQLREQASTEAALENTRIKLDRINWVCRKLVSASVRMLPKDLWERYRGNTIIDATRLDIAGRPNSSNPNLKRANPDPFSNRYRREGSHGGKGAKTDLAAYELETAVMGWNNPGETELFPFLIHAVSAHRSGALVGHGAGLVNTVREEYGLDLDRFLVIADRAYNGEAIENFHVPVRLMGCELVVDYKARSFGEQGTFEDLMMVDGVWYVNWIPRLLIDATKELALVKQNVSTARDTLYAANQRKLKKPGTPEVERKRAIKVAAAKEVLALAAGEEAKLLKRVEDRKRYQMNAKGLVDADGYQRYSYPDPKSDLTGKAKRSSRKSITVPLLIPENKSHAKRNQKLQPLKFLQKFPCKSATWRKWYGMRSLVETSNNLLKLASAEDIGNKKKRSGRGFAFHYLAATLAAASSNIRRIITYFEEEAQRSTPERIRVRRRKDSQGTPLPHSTEMAIASPAP
ncbi:MAG TPA: hypothetical protein VHZ98_16330 [Galbitalea sp.]|jgi:hypothetical protein|nr:hypothetical protein [Galbitalea sp.]